MKLKFNKLYIITLSLVCILNAQSDNDVIQPLTLKKGNVEIIIPPGEWVFIKTKGIAENREYKVLGIEGDYLIFLYTDFKYYIPNITRIYQGKPWGSYFTTGCLTSVGTVALLSSGFALQDMFSSPESKIDAQKRMVSHPIWGSVIIGVNAGFVYSIIKRIANKRIRYEINPDNWIIVQDNVEKKG